MRDLVFWLVVGIGVFVGAVTVEKRAAQSEAALNNLLLTASDRRFELDPKLPDFSQYSDVKEKKRAFFEFMRPLVEAENQRLEALHSELDQLSQREVLPQQVSKRLKSLADRYRIETESNTEQDIVQQLLRRVDVVPLSLALSQSANESAWGTSRFAKQGNNLFGQWCFKPGCGVVPTHRPEGASYEVARYRSPAASVRSYIHNLNTNAAFREFRTLRIKLRERGRALSGSALAEGLVQYSSRGDAYVSELQSMIRLNDLENITRI